MKVVAPGTPGFVILGSLIHTVLRHAANMGSSATQSLHM